MSISETKRRFTNWWIHWEDLHWPNPDSRDAIRRKAEKYAEANITSAIILQKINHFLLTALPSAGRFLLQCD